MEARSPGSIKLLHKPIADLMCHRGSIQPLLSGLYMLGLETQTQICRIIRERQARPFQSDTNVRTSAQDAAQASSLWYATCWSITNVSLLVLQSVAARSYSTRVGRPEKFPMGVFDRKVLV